MRVAYNTRVLDKSLDIKPEDKDFFIEIRSHFKTICASICQITDRKGLDQIINAVRYLDTTICYVIIGDGPGLPKLKKLIDEIGISDRVFLIGKRPAGYSYLPYIDVFCIPSHSEGFPLAMLEAASYGKAMVCSDLDVFKEVFTEEECVICQENNVESFVRGINTAINNKDSLGMKAQQKFDKAYSPEEFYNTHYKIYKEILER